MMKVLTIGCVGIASTLLLGTVGFALEDEGASADWLQKHAATKTTETTERDGNGNIKSIRIVKDTTIYIHQTETETRKPDAKGVIRTIGKTTISTDTLGGSATIIESPVAGTGSLVKTSITTVEKIPEGMLTTIYGRDKTGKMVVISRTTSAITNNGQAPTVIAGQ